LASQIGFTEKFKRFDNFELHYSVVNTTFLSPFVAEKYGITRGERHAILNLSLRELSIKGSTSVGMELSGRTWDLIQAQDLQFSKIREEDAIYFLAEFKFINEEWRFFELEFSPEGLTRNISLNLSTNFTLIKSAAYYESYYRKRQFRKDIGARKDPGTACLEPLTSL